MVTAILQYRFNVAFHPSLYEGNNYHHEEIGNFIQENLRSATLTDASLFISDIDNMEEFVSDENNPSFFVDIFIPIDDEAWLYNIDKYRDAITDYVLDEWEPSTVRVYDHYNVAHDEFLRVEHGDIPELLEN